MMQLPTNIQAILRILGAGQPQQPQNPQNPLAAFPAGVERIPLLLQQPLVGEDQRAMRHFDPGQNGPSFPQPQPSPLQSATPEGPPMANPFADPQQDLSSNPFAFLAERMLQQAGGQGQPAAMAPAAQQGPPLPRVPGINELLAETAQKLLGERNAPARQQVANQQAGLPRWQGVPDNAGLPLEMQQQRLGRMSPQERGRYVNMHTTINPNTGAIRPATPWQPNLAMPAGFVPREQYVAKGNADPSFREHLVQAVRDKADERKRKGIVPTRTPEQVARFEEHMRDLTDRYKLAKTPAQRRALVTLRAAAAGESRRWRMGGGRERLMAQQQWVNQNPELAMKQAEFNQRGALGFGQIESNERLAKARMDNTDAIAGRVDDRAGERIDLTRQGMTADQDANQAAAIQRHNAQFRQRRDYLMSPEGGGFQQAEAIRAVTADMGPLQGSGVSQAPIPPMPKSLGPASARRNLGTTLSESITTLGTEQGQFGGGGTIGGPLAKLSRGTREIEAELLNRFQRGEFTTAQVPDIVALLRRTMDPEAVRRIQEGEVRKGELLWRLLRGQHTAFDRLTPDQKQTIRNNKPAKWFQ